MLTSKIKNFSSLLLLSLFFLPSLSHAQTSVGDSVHTTSLTVSGATVQGNLSADSLSSSGNIILDGNIGLDSDAYLNFDKSETGTGGHGLRDNSGVMQFKNSGGIWTNISDFLNSLTGLLRSERGAGSGVASLDATSKIPSAQLPDSLLGSVSYQGTWNAITDSPSMTGAAADNQGYYFKISVAGTTSVDGEADWGTGDWIISNGATWDKVDNTEQYDLILDATPELGGNLSLNGEWISGDGGDEGIKIGAGGEVGIGTGSFTGTALNVFGDGQFSGSISSASLTSTNLTINSLTADSILTASLTATGNVSIDGTLSVTGATLITNNLTVTGAVVLNDTLSVSGAVIISNNLTATGNTTLNGILSVSGAIITDDDLTISGNDLTFGNGATISNSTDNIIKITTGTGGSLTISTGNLIIGNDTPDNTLNGEDTFLSGTLEVDGNSRFDGALAFASSSAITLNPHGTGSGETSEVRFAELALQGSNYISLKAPDSISANVDFVLPDADGTSSQVLQTNGSGSLSWASISGTISSGSATGSTLLWNGSDWIESTVLKNNTSNISITSDLAVSGTTILGNTLSVSGTTTISSDLILNGGTLTSPSTLTISTSTGNLILSPLNASGIISITKSIIPSTDTIDIGNDANPIRDLYVSANSIRIAGQSLSNQSGQLVWGGSGGIHSTSGTAFLSALSVTGVTTFSGNLNSSARADFGEHAANIGFNVTTNSGTPAAVTGTADGDMVWDTVNDKLYIYGGSSFDEISGSSVWSESGAISVANYSGSVGIGITSPSTKLEVTGTISGSDILSSGSLSASGVTLLAGVLEVGGATTITNDLTATGNTTLNGLLSISGATILAANLTVDTSTFFVDSTDHEVGIGTLSPNNSLSVSGAITLISSPSPNVTSNAIYSSGTSLMWNGSEMTGGAFTQSGTIAFFTSGNVGIGTDDPTTDLEVVGIISGSDIFSSGSLSASGTTILGNTLSVSGTTTISSDLILNGGTLTSPSTLTISTSTGNLILSPLNASGIISITKSIIPSTDTIDIGNDANPIRDLYVSANSIRIAGQSLSNDSGQLVWGGSGGIHSTSGTAFLSALSVTGTTVLDGTLSISGDVTVDTDTLFVDVSESKVGIGTTSPNNSLSISGAITLQSTPNPAVTSNAIYASGASLYWNGNAMAGGAFTQSGTLAFYTPGNIGIGTTAPWSDLHLSSDSVAISDLSDSGKYQLLLHDSSPANDKGVGIGFHLGHATNSDNVGASIIAIRQGSWGTANLAFYTKTGAADGTDPVERMRIGDDGNVGIGTTNPKSTLHVNGRMTIDDGAGNFELYANQTAADIILNNGFPGRIEFNSSDGDWHIQAGVTGTAGDSVTNNDKLIIKNSGKIGIGTDDPAYLLEIQKDIGWDTSDTLLLLDSANGGAGHGSSIDWKGQTTGGGAVPGYFSAIAGIAADNGKDGKIEFRTSGNGATNTSRLTNSDTKMVINHEGKVSIGLGATIATVILEVACPTGFLNVKAGNNQLGCIQESEQGSANWQDSSNNCFTNFGGKLPTANEWYTAALNYTLTDETGNHEWIDDIIYNAGFQAVRIGLSSITDVGAASLGDSGPYRCWLPR